MIEPTGQHDLKMGRRVNRLGSKSLFTKHFAHKFIGNSFKWYDLLEKNIENYSIAIYIDSNDKFLLIFDIMLLIMHSVSPALSQNLSFHVFPNLSRQLFWVPHPIIHNFQNPDFFNQFNQNH